MFSNTEREYIKHIKEGYMIKRPEDEPEEGYMILSRNHERVLMHRINGKIKAMLNDLDLVKGSDFERFIRAWKSNCLKKPGDLV